MNQPQDTTIALTQTRSRWMRSPRSWKIPWFALSRWAFGVFGPVICFGGAVLLEDMSPMLGPRSGMLVFAAMCVVAQLVAILRPARGDVVAAVLAGALTASAVVGTLYSMMLTPLAVVFFVFAPPVGIIGLLPVAATYIFFRSASMERRSLDRLLPRTCRIALICGFVLPWAVGWGAFRVARRFESRVVASYVNAEIPLDFSQLERFRSIAWMHDWPELKRIYRDWPSEGARHRAGEAWSALTGKPAETLSPID
jgi:hypothetical protein